MKKITLLLTAVFVLSAASLYAQSKDANTLSIKDKNAAIDYYNSGVEYFNSRNYDKAIAALTDSIRINPYEPEAYECRGSAYLFKGNLTQARGC